MRRFAFRFDGPQGMLVHALGVHPRTSGVTLSSERIKVRFGPWSTEAPLEEVEAWHRTGPYRWWKVMGPPRVSFLDQGLTYATNRHDGVCITFRRPVAGALPLGLRVHPGLTVTVADPRGFMAALSELRSRVPASRDIA